MRPRIFVILAFLAAAPVSADEGVGVNVGDLCSGPTDPAPRPGLLCRPAFTVVDGGLQEEWEYDQGHVLNGRRGDSILSPGCELVANLLKRVSPPQTYSHSGIMVEDRYKIRHSTASVDRMLAYGDGDPPGAEGVQEKALKFAWPGTITQTAGDAFGGAVLTDPESGGFFHLQSFNPTAIQCGASGDLIPDTVLKPPPLVDSDPATGARARLELAAAAAESIEGHYRFFGYTNPTEVLYSTVNPGNWADGTVGTVCSALVWRAMKDVGFTLEGDSTEPEDVAWGGGLVDPQTPDGMYLYTKVERDVAAEKLYGDLYNMVWEQIGGADLIVDAADDVGNQVVNCFGFDWCGETYTTWAAQNGCDSGDGRAQDSPCWRNEGAGWGRAVSPDNMVAWDKAPDGPYGYREDLSYQAGGFYRVHRWGPADGTATLRGTVTDGGSAAQAWVTVDGLAAAMTTNASGGYRIEAVPQGPWTVRACASGDRGAAAIVDMPPSGTLFQDLALGPSCDAAPNPGKWRRRVRIQGTVKIVDTEDFSDDEVDTWTFDRTVDLEPNTEGNPEAAHAEFTWQRCTGDEVMARFRFELDLDQNDRSVKVASVSEMFEGESCPNDDLDDTTNKNRSVVEDGSASLVYVMQNEEWGGEDRIHVNLTITNLQAPPQ